MRRAAVTRAAVAFAALTVLVASCDGRRTDNSTAPPKPARGGTFRIVAAGDVDSLDPARISTPFSSMLFRVLVRTLVTYAALPGEAGTKLVPDLAQEMPRISSDGLVYTFSLQTGVKYQRETATGRDVQSPDIRYAIERAFYPSVGSRAGAKYFTDVFTGDEQFLKKPGPDRHIDGIDVSDPKRIVFRLKRPIGDFLYRLALPVAAPVPEDYAQGFDGKLRSDYGRKFAATGPYEIERQGNEVTGYQPGVRIVLVRNSSWSPATDSVRMAFPDRIDVVEGFDNVVLAVDKILAGEYDYNGDFGVPADKQRHILSDSQTKRLMSFNTTNCISFMVMNTSIKPFDNPLVRQAVAWVLDKSAMRQAIGGERSGAIATHMLLPGIPGFDEVGKRAYDPYKSEEFKGDPSKARELMIRAGYKDGKFSGRRPLLLAGGNTESDRRLFEAIATSLGRIGIAVEPREYRRSALPKVLADPRTGLALAASMRWCSDYPDGSTVIPPLFDGRRAGPNGSNYSHLKDAKLDQAIDRALAASGPSRAAAWAEADQLVMGLAPVVPWLWDSAAHLISRRVVGFQFAVFSSSVDLAVVAVRREP